MPNDATAARYSALTKRDDSAALRSLEQWLTTLQAGQTVPAAQAELIPAALREATRLCEPASREQIAIEVDRLMDWAAAFNVPVKDVAAVTAAYLEGLKNVPADLLAIAMERARVFHRWGQRLPLPSEIIGHVKDEIELRQLQRGKLTMASRLTKEPPSRGLRWNEMTAEQQQEFDRHIAGLMAKWPTHRPTT